MALVLSCGPAVSPPSPSPSLSALPSGVYVYQPTPMIWELLTLVDGQPANGAGAVFEWSCAGRRWAIGAFAARIEDGYLRFGDERFVLDSGVPAPLWHLGSDPRMQPQPVCPGPIPTTKPAP